MKRKILVFSVDTIPFKGQPVAGGGLRAWGLGQALTRCGHEVIHSVPARLLEGRNDVPWELSEYAYDATRLKDIIVKVGPDVLLFEQWGLLEYVPDDGIPTVLDLHGSLILENTHRGQLNWSVNAEAKIRAFRKADLLLVPGLRQRDYFKPWMMLAGQDPRELPIEVLPVSMPPEMPVRKKVRAVKSKVTDPLFVFGGNLWPWIDPFPALDIVARTLTRKNKGKLNLFTAHPKKQEVLPQEPSVQTKIDLGKLERLKRVQQKGMIPHEKLMTEYLGATVAVDVYQHNEERELAITTRTLEYMWCGLPVIYADYAELAGPIAEADAGWIVDPTDEKRITQVVESILADPAAARKKGENAQKLIASRYTWDKTIAPLDAFCREPIKKGKGRPIFHRFNDQYEDLKQVSTQKAKELEYLATQLADEKRVLQLEIDGLRGKLSERDEAPKKQLAELKKHMKAEIAWRDKELSKRDSRYTSLSDQHHTDVKLLQDQLHRECAWRDDAIRDREERLKAENAKREAECRWRDEEIRRLTSQRETDVSNKSTEIVELNFRMSKEVAHRDEKLIRLDKEFSQKLKELGKKNASELAWRDEEIRRLNAHFQEVEATKSAEMNLLNTKLGEEVSKRDARYEKLTDKLQKEMAKANDLLNKECNWRDEEIRRLRSLHEKELVAKSDEISRLSHQMGEEIRRRDTRYEVLGDLQAKEIQSRDEQLRVLHLERARDIRELNEELQRRDQRVAEAHGERQKIVAQFDGLKANINELVTERDALRKLASERLAEVQERENSLSRAVENEALLLQEIGTLRKVRDKYQIGIDEAEAALATQKQLLATERELKNDLETRSANLEADLAGGTARMEHLHQELAAHKNWFPHKLYKASMHGAKRILIQYPLLIGLYVLNFTSNVYMHWWTQRHRQQVFPGM